MLIPPPPQVCFLLTLLAALMVDQCQHYTDFGLLLGVRYATHHAVDRYCGIELDDSACSPGPDACTGGLV